MVKDFENTFTSHMQQHIDIDEITNMFNVKFNSFIPHEYEGVSLGIDDCLSGEIVPHSYQNAEVRRLSEQGSGICGFGVGLGKSFTSLALAAYNTKKGRSKKTCFVVPSAVLENWYHEARFFYNENYFRNNVFFVGLEVKKDKEGSILRKAVLDEQGEQRIGKTGKTVMQDEIIFRNSSEDIFDAMWQIQQSSHSIVVMSKEKFASIPLKPSTRSQYTDEMVSRNLMSNSIAKKVNEGGNKKKSYNDAVHEERLKGQFSGGDRAKKGELPFLEDMGFTSIITDESHFFKNSFEAGKKSQGIAYLPTAPTSQIAIDMAMKSHYLRNLTGGSGLYGLTATPVTNSPIEIFNMLSLFCPLSEFEKMGIYTPDDFVRVFGNVEQVEKMSVSGDIKTVMGLVGFQNLDGLRNLFHKYVNVKTVQDVDDEIHVPFAEEFEENIEMREEQKKIYNYLRHRATAVAKKEEPKDPSKFGLDNQAVPPLARKDSIFSIIRDMDRLTTDLDMFYRTLTFSFPKKYKEQVKQIVSELPDYVTYEYESEYGTEIGEKEAIKEIIDDNGETFLLKITDSLEDKVLMQFDKFDIIESEIAHPITPKYAKLMENLKKHFETQGKQIIFTEEKTQHQKIRRIIVHHLPITSEQIGIINAEDASGDKLDKIAKAYNAGAIKIIIANKKAEVGVNLQNGTTGIHHLTLPWTPASINQRNGRGVRQGNSAQTVNVYYYCGKGTFDSYRKDLLKSKSNWINDLLMGKSSKVENGDATSNDEFLDMLADNPEEARRMRAERLAIKAEKAKENERRNLANKLQILANLHETIMSSDKRKKDIKESIEEKIEVTKDKILKTEENISSENDKEKQKKFQNTLIKEQEKLNKFEERLQNLDTVFEEELAKFEGKKRQIKIALNNAEKEGRLPFDSSLIENPHTCIVDSTGQVFAIGDYYEFSSGAIGKVSQISSSEKKISFDWVGEKLFYGLIPLIKIKNCKKVTYSNEEIEVKRLIADRPLYGNLLKYDITSDTFYEAIDSTMINTHHPLVILEKGQYKIVKEIDESMKLAYPDINNEAFKKAICLYYLNNQYSFDSFGGKYLAEGLLGKNYENIAKEYATKP